MKILLIGPFIAPVGGPVRVLDTLLKALHRDNRIDDVKIISTGRGHKTLNPIVNIVQGFKVFLHTIRFIRHVDIISFQSSARGMTWFGPILYCFSRFFSKPLIIRLFGGEFESYYNSLGSIRRWIINRTVLSSEVCLFQTKRQVKYFRRSGARRVEWYCNHTRQFDLQEITGNMRNKCDKFIFLGQVREGKGIGVVLDAVHLMTNGIIIDIYGPLYEPYTLEFINARGNGKVRYKGVLNFKQVQDVLFEYDALVLPTFHHGEGYPGVVIEAYSHGLPVIATRWMSIPEIVDENSGILIEPHSPIEFAEAVNLLNNDQILFRRLQRGAIEKREQFSDNNWTNRFVEICLEIAAKAV